MSESSQTLSTSAVALGEASSARVSVYLYVFLVLSNLSLLTYEFFFKERNSVTSIVNYRIDFGPILLFFAGVGITIFILDRIFPDNSGTRGILVKFWRIAAVLFLMLAAADFVSTGANLRYVDTSYAVRYGPLHIAATVMQTLSVYFAALCLVSRSQQEIPASIRAAVVLGQCLMIDGLASGLLAAVVMIALFPNVLRPTRVAFVSAAFAALFGYAQYEKIQSSLERSLYFQSIAGAEKYAGWIVERFSTHALSLNYYLSHADPKETDRVFWEVTTDNFQRRICLIERLFSSGPSCPTPGRYRSFSSYNYEIMQGEYDAFGGMSPGLFAASVAIFGPALGTVAAGLVIAIVGHGLQSVYRGSGIGLVGVLVLIYLLRGVFDENTDLPIIFSGATMDWLAFCLALAVGTRRVQT